MNERKRYITKKRAGLTILFLFFVLLVPSVLAILLELPLFTFAPGEVGSWISFWGSYIGAIFGASAVYFVSKFQMSKQSEQQIKAIEIENKQSTKREMKKFYLTNKLEKIEEIQKILVTISIIILDLNNELLEFALIMESKKDENYKSNRNIDLNEEIYKYRINLKKNHNLMLSELTRLSVLSGYIESVEESSSFIRKEFIKLYQEIKKYYYTDEIHRELLIGGNPHEPFVLENVELMLKKITYLQVETLRNEMKTILEEIQDYINN